MKIQKRMLSLALPLDKAARVESQAKEQGIEVGDVIAKALEPITDYPCGDCVWVTIAIPTDAYRVIEKYAKANDIDLNGDGHWLLDEILGRGFDHLQETGSHK